MVYFNDPLDVPDHPNQAVLMALEIRDIMNSLCNKWKKKGFELHFGAGISNGFATLGGMGFSEYLNYTIVGTVTNIASRLCSEAKADHILISDNFLTAVESLVNVESVGELSLKGINKPIKAYNILSLKSEAAPQIAGKKYGKN